MCKYFIALDKLNANRARVAVLDVEIPKLTNLAKKLENDVSISTSAYGDDTAAIRATGSHGDPTQRRAMKELPEDVRQLYDDIRAMTIERHRTAAWIELAERALAFLNGRERLIVSLRAVEHMSWVEVADEVLESTGKEISERACRLNYDRACDKIEPFFVSGTMDSAQAEQMYTKKRAYVKTAATA